MLWAYQRTFHGPDAGRFRGLRDLLPREWAAVAPVVAVMLVIGVYPKVVLDRINPTTDGVVRWVRTVEIDQPGLPGGLRAGIQPAYRPPAGIELAQGAPASDGGTP
jgi:NADH-quinone oxidoreductase subunit M